METRDYTMNVRPGTPELATELARLMTIRMGVRVARPDAVRLAVQAAIDSELAQAEKVGGVA
jgi:hypothetical protein